MFPDTLNIRTLCLRFTGDSRSDRILQNPFFYWRWVFAVFRAVIQSADAAPNDFFLAVLCPCCSAIRCSAVSAEEQLGQSVFTWIFAKLGFCTDIFDLAFTVTPWYFLLNPVEHCPFYNRRMIIFHIVHREFTGILFWLFADAVHNVGLLQQCVTFIFFIGQYREDAFCCPVGFSSWGENAVSYQTFRNIYKTCPCKILRIDSFDNFCFFRYDFRFTVRTFPISEVGTVAEWYISVFDALPFAYFNIHTDGFTLSLWQTAEEGYQKFAGYLQCVDAFLFEQNGNSAFFQLAYILQTVEIVSWEPWNRFGDDHINFTFTAVFNHSHEVRAFFGDCSGDSFICIDPRHLPVGFHHDHIGVHFFLCFKAVFLFFLICRYTAVCCDTLWTKVRIAFSAVFRLGRNHSDCFRHCHCLRWHFCFSPFLWYFRFSEASWLHRFSWEVRQSLFCWKTLHRIQKADLISQNPLSADP